MSSTTPILMKDVYFTSKERTVLTKEQLKIPGIEMLGKHTIKSALPPLEPHYHANCFELTFVLEGTVTFWTEKKEYRLNGGDIFLTFPDEVHGSNMSPVSRSEIIWFQIDISNPDSLLFLDAATSNQMISCMYSLTAHTFHMKYSMPELIREAFDRSTHGNPPQLIASYISLILQLMLTDFQPSTDRLSEDIQASVEYIKGHVTNQISLGELAELCCLSVSAYKQKFKTQMGISPRSYINMQKIELAKQLLEQKYSITETSMILGFNTSSYFTTVFKKYAFQSPKEYVDKKESVRFSEIYSK